MALRAAGRWTPVTRMSSSNPFRLVGGAFRPRPSSLKGEGSEARAARTALGALVGVAVAVTALSAAPRTGLHR
jgi:hypothetical protein